MRSNTSKWDKKIDKSIRQLSSHRTAVRQKAVKILEALSESMSGRIAAAGGIPPLLCLLKHRSAAIAIRMDAATALYNIADDPTNQERIVAAGGIAHLMRLLSDDSVALQQQVVNIVYRFPEAIEPLVGLLKKRRSDCSTECGSSAWEVST